MKSAKAKTVTGAEVRGRRWRGFRSRSQSRLGGGPASSKRWGEGRRKNGEDKPPDIPTTFQILPGVCGKLLRARHGLFRARGNFTESPAKLPFGVRTGWRGKCLFAACHASLRSQRACLRRFSGEERNGSESNQQPGTGRERLRSEVKWNAAETPELGNSHAGSLRLSARFGEASNEVRC
jgi:hypothetical protein